MLNVTNLLLTHPKFSLSAHQLLWVKVSSMQGEEFSTQVILSSCAEAMAKDFTACSSIVQELYNLISGLLKVGRVSGINYSVYYIFRCTCKFFSGQLLRFTIQCKYFTLSLHPLGPIITELRRRLSVSQNSMLTFGGPSTPKLPRE